MTGQQIAAKVLTHHKDWTVSNKEEAFFSFVKQFNNLAKTKDLKLIQEVHSHIARDLVDGVKNMDWEKFRIWEEEQNKTEEVQQQD